MQNVFSVRQRGLRGARGLPSGPLGDETVGPDELKGDESSLAGVREKIDPAKGAFSRAAHGGLAGAIGGKLAHEIAADDADYGGDVQSAVDDARGRDVYMPDVRAVAALDNPLGSRFRGPGRLTRAAAQGGIYQDPQQTYADQLPVAFNKVALFRLFDRIRNPLTPLNIFAYGDSVKARGLWTVTGSISGTALTVADAAGYPISIGTAITGGGVAAGTKVIGYGGSPGTYVVSVSQTVASGSLNVSNGGGYAGSSAELQNLIRRMFERKGVSNPINIVNRSIGGTKWSDLQAIQDIDTVGGATDMLLIGFGGINEGRTEGGDIEADLEVMAATVDAKLTAIRSSSGFADPENLAIVLIGPTNTTDPQHSRTNIWYERVRNVLVAAAIKHTCFFHDPYPMMPGDVRWLAGVDGGMDDPFSNGQPIHPREIVQALWIADLVDHMIGFSDLSIWDNNALISVEPASGWAPASGYQPPAISRDRDGWAATVGAVSGPAAADGATIAELPATYFLQQGINVNPWVVASSQGPIMVRIDPVDRKSIQLHGQAFASSGWISLAGIRFPTR